MGHNGMIGSVVDKMRMLAAGRNWMTLSETNGTRPHLS